MKKVFSIFAFLALILMFAFAANAADSTDIKYYQDQSASWGQGVIDSVATESGCKSQTSLDVSLQGKGFGAINTVPCAGVLGVGQVDLVGNLTYTTLDGKYSQVTKQYALSGSAAMNQLGGLSSASTGASLCSTGLAGSIGCLNQTQTLNMGATVALPFGVASHNYTGTQTANIGGGSF